MNVKVFGDDGGLVFVNELLQKVFSTGSRGYYTNGKIVIDGKRYQAMVTLVEIGSKPVK